MLRPYRELFAASGARAFSLAGFVARMPISMLGISFVLLVSAVTGSYATAGGVAAASALTQALVGPMLARWVDRLGQARVAVPSLAVFAVSLTAFMTLAVRGGPTWTLYVTAAVAGGSLPNIGALVRARWAVLYTGTPRLHTAYALESTVDEVIFIIGPVLATVLATQVSRLAGLAAILVFAVTGTLALATLRSTEPRPTGSAQRHRRAAIRSRGLIMLVMVFACLGSLFGAMEIVVVGFATEQGNRPMSGVILALYALGSFISGIVFGAMQFRTPVHRRFAMGAVGMALSVLPLPFIDDLVTLGAVAVVAGFAISPTLISGFALVERLVPAGQLTEGLTWLSSGIMIGVTAGTAVAGQVIDAAGSGRAFLVPVVSGAIAAMTAIAGSRWLRPAVTEEGPGAYPRVEQLGR